MVLVSASTSIFLWLTIDNCIHRICCSLFSTCIVFALTIEAFVSMPFFLLLQLSMSVKSKTIENDCNRNAITWKRHSNVHSNVLRIVLKIVTKQNVK